VSPPSASTPTRPAPASAPTPGRAGSLLLFAGLFSLSVTGAWAWFHLGVEQNPGDGLWLQVSTSLPGYTFKPEPIGESAIAILGTTNFINGTFYRQGSENNASQAIKVFFATWQARDGKGLTVLHHTPDICWVGAGWTPVDVGTPGTILMTLGASADGGTMNLDFPFESRTFQSPASRLGEFVIWATLIGGKPLPESGRFAEAGAGEHAPVQSSRTLALHHLVESVARRLPARGTKQFIRFSVVQQHDWNESFRQVQEAVPGILGLAYGIH
jgi:hypothetical protein